MTPLQRNRLKRVGRALKVYKGSEAPDEADMRDLLTDLMHFAAANRFDFDGELYLAQGNFLDERAGEVIK